MDEMIVEDPAIPMCYHMPVGSPKSKNGTWCPACSMAWLPGMKVEIPHSLKQRELNRQTAETAELTRQAAERMELEIQARVKERMAQLIKQTKDNLVVPNDMIVSDREEHSFPSETNLPDRENQ